MRSAGITRDIAPSRAVVVLLSLAVAAGAHQSPAVTQPESLADIVPASAGLFLEINPLESPDGSSRSRNALMLIEMVVGPVQNPDLPGNDWRRILLDALGLQSGDQARELLKHQIALVAPSWDRLGEAMIVIRHRPDDRLLNDVFRPDDADSLDARGNVAVFRTRTNLSAATDGACLVISQRRDPASLYRGTVKRMLGDGPPALSADAGFDEQIRALPPGRDITVYVRPAATPDAASPPTFLSSVLSSMAAGVYLRDDYIHFAFSGTGARAAVDRPSATLSVGDLKELPLTTVAAWCTPIDVSSLFRALLDRHVGADAPAYVQFFKTMLNVDEFDERVLSRLGPGAMVVWDQDLGTGSELPQLAVILKAQDAPQCASRMADTVQLVVNWQDIRERDRSGRRLQLSRSDYLGTTLFEVAFPNAGGDADRHHLLSAVRPAFAAVGESLVIAFSADHVRNIIDARFGLAPTLEALPGMASTLRVQDTEPFLMGVAQPALAAQIVGTWLRQTDRGPMRWLMDDDASPFRRVSASADRPFTLGIGTQPGPRPGTVHVARVYDGGRAAGQLTPGDTIVGVNGQLLGLDAASRDLRRMVGRFPDGGSWVFRVERGDAVVDVTIPAPQPAVAGIDPTTALRQLQALFRRIDFGSIRATETSPDRFTAHLTLRFTDDPNAS